MAEKEQKELEVVEAGPRTEPISGVYGVTIHEDGSAIIEMPVLGKIAIGHPAGWTDEETGEIYKVQKQLNHFVFKKKAGNQWVTDHKTTEMYGNDCKLLDVVLPATSLAGNYYDAMELWGKVTGLMCQGNREWAWRWFEGTYKTGMPRLPKPHKVKCPCNLYWDFKAGCPLPSAKRACNFSMTLNLILAKQPAFGGCWKLTSGSGHSGRRIRSSLTNVAAKGVPLCNVPFVLRVDPFIGHRQDEKGKRSTQTNYAMSLVIDSDRGDTLQHTLAMLDSSNIKRLAEHATSVAVEVLSEPESMRAEEQTKEFREQPTEKKEETTEQKKAGDNLFGMEKEPSEPPKTSEKKEEGPPPSPPPPESEHPEPPRDDLSDLFGE